MADEITWRCRGILNINLVLACKKCFFFTEKTTSHSSVKMHLHFTEIADVVVVQASILQLVENTHFQTMSLFTAQLNILDNWSSLRRKFSSSSGEKTGSYSLKIPRKYCKNSPSGRIISFSSSHNGKRTCTWPHMCSMQLVTKSQTYSNDFFNPFKKKFQFDIIVY